MKLSTSTLSAIFCSMLAVATAAPEGYVVGDVWSTLTPEAKIPSDYATDYQTTFGIAIEPVVSSVELTSVSSTSTSPESSYASSISESRDYSKIITQIGDGQIQAPSSTPVAIITQIGDGQIQATTSTPSPTSTSVPVITQIGDGQIQAATTTTSSSSSSSSSSSTTDVDVITQIGDGQIQAQHSSSSSEEEIVYLTKTENDVVTKYTTYCPEEESSTSSFEGDVTETRTDTVDVDDLSTTFLSTSTTTIYPSGASTSSDDDVTTLTTTPTTTVMVVLTAFYDDPQLTTVSDSTTTSASASSPSASPSSSLATTSATAIPSKHLFKKDITSQSCMSEGSLAMTIKDSVLTDIKGRVGSIVANRQFQFDGPPPQAGAIYAAGWSVSPDGYLALGNQTIFYQCLSGTFYNLYDEIIGGQCEAVRFGVVNLIDC